MARVNQYTFTIEQPPSADTVERMACFLANTLAKYKNITVAGTFRTLSQEEIGKLPLVNPAALIRQKEAS